MQETTFVAILFGMIQKVRIQNFKSVLDLEIELGRVNVFIGENGSGKTSVLEGIVMGSGAIENRLNDEFLGSRIRNVDAALMISAFAKNINEPEDYMINLEFFGPHLPSIRQEIFSHDSSSRMWNSLSFLEGDDGSERKGVMTLTGALNIVEEIEDFASRTENKDVRQVLDSLLVRISSIIRGEEEVPRLVIELKTFLLYAPENHFLRRFEEEGQIRPLGIRGEGLFRHLTELAKEEPETLAKISENLQLIDWFEGFSIPNDLQFTERRIAITDRFIKDTIAQIDQRSTNEGFLYLLFYFTLFLSKYTPAFFAIDNIDNALNPRLCAKLVQALVKLAAENDKQAIFTTHNPAVLDGLDLEDDAQRLFVIYRNANGETKAHRVMPLQEVEGVEMPTLSEAFLRGYLGGLPQNF